MNTFGVKPDAYIILITARRLHQCITIIGINCMWKLHDGWEHDIVLAHLGSLVFVPTEKTMGRLMKCCSIIVIMKSTCVFFKDK